MEATTAPLFQDNHQPSEAIVDLPEVKTACIVAIDPGLTGAVAFYFTNTPDRIAVEDMPVVNGEVDVHGLERMFRRMGATRGVIELVGPMPKDGSVQGFKFGMSFGMAKAALALSHLPFSMVTPQTWKRHHGLLGKADPKEAGRALAIRLFPACSEHFARKKDHGRADAALLARFAAETLR